MKRITGNIQRRVLGPTWLVYLRQNKFLFERVQQIQICHSDSVSNTYQICQRRSETDVGRRECEKENNTIKVCFKQRVAIDPLALFSNTLWT